MRVLLALCASLAMLGSAAAGELTVTVRDAAGQPVADAVVTLAAPGAHAPIRFDWPYVMSQQGIQFRPFVLIVPVGAVVKFPNKDKVRHHVYSFSPVKPFQLKLYGEDETRTVTFDRPGIVALGCNIHDRMIGFIDVVDTPYAAKTDAQGRAVIANAPTGTATLTVWHPNMKGKDNRVSRPLAVPAGRAQQAVTVDVRAPAR